MSNKINGAESRPVAVGASQPVARTRDAAGGRGAAEKDALASGVHITEDARRLAALESTIQSLPEIDAGRVADFARALEQGRYRIDPERIAQQLLRQEQELARQLPSFGA